MISVIIPVYNNEKYIARCLDSLIRQTYSEFEALVINDGSKDNSGKIIQEYAAKDVRIRYFEQKNQGVSVARNKGLDNAKGEYVLFLDGDDWLDNDVLERLHNEMTEHNLDCVSYMFRHVYEDGSPSKEDGSGDDIRYQLKSPKESARFFDITARHAFYTSQQHLFKREIIEKNNLRFAQGIKCGEDGLFAHIYSMFVQKGVILSSCNGYNYYHHSDSCIYVNKEPWENIIGENIKCCTYFAQYLKQQKIDSVGGYELANRCWEFILHFIEIETKFPDKEKAELVLKSDCMKQIVYPYIFHYGSFQRKLLLCAFILSRCLFRKVIGVK